MKDSLITLHIISWLFGITVLAIGVANLLLVHPVPGVIFLLLSIVYAPQTDAFLRGRFTFSIPLIVKIVLGLFIIWFTLGVSVLGDMID